MSLYAIECDGSDSGEAPIPIKFIRQKSERLKKADSPKRTRKRGPLLSQQHQQAEPKVTEIVHDLKQEVILTSNKIDNDHEEEEKESQILEDQENDEFIVEDKEETTKNDQIVDSIQQKAKNDKKEERSYTSSDDGEDIFNVPVTNSEEIAHEDLEIKPIIITEEDLQKTNPVKEIGDLVEEQLIVSNRTHIINTKQHEIYQIDENIENTHLNFPLLFTITRQKKMHLNGKSLFFKLYETNKQILIAKCKGTRDIIPITTGDIIHLGGSSEHVLVCAENESQFSLRERNRTGNELMTINYFERGNGSRREAIISFMNPIAQITRLQSIDYSLEKEYDDFEIKSVKNTVFRTKESDVPLLWVRKIAENTLSVQVQFEISPVFCMAIAISSFICKITE